MPVDGMYNDILFGNYLCLANKKRIRIYGLAEQHRDFVRQNHTAFELRKVGSSEEYLGSSENRR